MNKVKYEDIIGDAFGEQVKESTMFLLEDFSKANADGELSIDYELIKDQLPFLKEYIKGYPYSKYRIVITYCTLKKIFNDITVKKYDEISFIDIINYVVYRGKNKDLFSIKSLFKYIVNSDEISDKFIDLVNIGNINILLKLNDINPGILKELNISYLDNSELNLTTLFVTSLLKAGVKPKTLLPKVTRKQANFLVNSFNKDDVTVRSIQKPEWFFHAIDLGIVDFGMKLEELKEFLDYDETIQFVNYMDDWKTFNWVCRNKERLKKSEKYLTSKGVYATIHYNRLVEHFNTDLHENKDTDSFKKIKDKYLHVLIDEIENAIKENVALHKFPYKVTDDRVKQLLESYDLFKEGSNLKHCVVTYTAEAARGNCYIFHVDDGTEHGATVEVKLNDKNKWFVNQSRGLQNMDSRKAKQIMEDFLNNLQKEKS